MYRENIYKELAESQACSSKTVHYELTPKDDGKTNKDRKTIDHEKQPEDDGKTNEDQELEPPPEPIKKEEKPINMSPGAVMLRSLLNDPMKIELSDKRVLIGIFLCTDRDANIILGSCSEYLPESERNHPEDQEPRILGLTMVPGSHIVSICADKFKLGFNKMIAECSNDDEDDDVIV